MAASASIPPSTSSRGKVLVAMSGGVDSSVAAALLQRQGYEVVGCFMRLGSEEGVEPDEHPHSPQSDQGSVSNDRQCATSPRSLTLPLKLHHQGCCSVNDAADARLVAAMLNVPFYVLNFRKQFERVINYFVSEYNAGRTPNPCVRCNDWLKFGKLVELADSIGAQYVATGHYARVERSPDGEARLMRGLDRGKDQSYVLFGTRRATLPRLLLPIGELQKLHVRSLAEEFGLPVFNKPDSQEICFVPDNDYAGLVTRRSPETVRPGAVIDKSGRVLGEHAGHQHFTIGQRRGLGLSSHQPLYVLQRDAASNTVTVGEKADLQASGLIADQANWLAELPASGSCMVRIRYNSQPVPGRVTKVADDRFEVWFNEPQSAVTPGQAVVCYDGDQALGGGWIVSAELSR